MNEIDVRIVEIEPMRLACVWGFGALPEVEAWQKLKAWAGPLGYMDDHEAHPVFGFNNPDPTPGSPNYGYELWMKVDDGEPSTVEASIREFRGGLYAVTRCEVGNGDYEVIGRTWRKLVTWREDSAYRCGSHQWLEQSVFDVPPGVEFVLDLCLPIAP